jgi:putative membrane protein
LLVINAVLVMICDQLVDGFHVYSFWSALWFSVLLSLSQSIVYKLIEKKQ